MRTLPILLVAAAALGSCTTASPQELAAQAAREQGQLAALTAGKVAGAPISCLPSYRSNNMTVVSENVIAFRDGQKRVYINNMQGGCLGLAPGRNALVTQTTGSSLCRGDIAHVLDTASRMNVGTCVFGDFVPYTRVGP